MSDYKKYPYCLIPHDGLKRVLPLKEILRQEIPQGKVCYVVRRTKSEIVFSEDLNDGVYILQHVDSHIQRQHIDDLSMNIIQENLEEVAFRYQRDDMAYDWDGLMPNIEEEKTRLQYLNDSRYLVYDAKTMFSEEQFSDLVIQNEPSMEELIKALNETTPDKEYYTELQHKPSKMNYWHVVLTVFNNDGTIKKFSGKSQDKKIYAKIRESLFSQCVQFDIANNIDYSKYMKVEGITDEEYTRKVNEVRETAESLECKCIG